MKKLESLYGRALVNYLKKHPESATDDILKRLNHADWFSLLKEKPEFADRCPQQFGTEESFLLMKKQPQLIKFCKAELPNFTIAMWITLVDIHPQMIKFAPYEKFSSDDWGEVIAGRVFLQYFCPWDKISMTSKKDNFGSMYWGICLQRDPQLAEKVNFRMDELLLRDFLCKNPQYLDRVDPKTLSITTRKAIFVTHGKWEEHCSYTHFTGSDWCKILLRSPEYAIHCKWEKLSARDWETLLQEQPQHYRHCDWKKLSSHQVDHLVFKHHPFAAYVPPEMIAPNTWFSLLKKHPELLLRRDGTHYLCSFNSMALEDAGFWSELDNGLYPLYDILRQNLKGRRLPLGDLFGSLDACDGATFLIYRKIEMEQSRRFFRIQLLDGNWQLLEEVYDLEPAVVEKIIGKDALPFLLTLAGPDKLLQKYLTTHNAADICDKLGNTLLHAALLRGTYVNIMSLLKEENPYRARYEYLRQQGCDPDIKNKKGYSCNDLLEGIRKKIEQYKVDMQSDFYQL